ncbi:hemolysin-III related-domain-containing protein [Yarrowia lipolytica]|uniref:YALI0B11242p n=2 Tax=Yarrowia lipolytica TaxID=4952 RepID=Q6CF11_YARLI|nr:YALI0B11242p [Yarrowia lipolytica CLIB122]AOW01540.1 hypothetical protein YALI1_B14924g [Yarrowia lipolytica]KAB8281111.1 hemolysin-III related-domain-containing protein [Yarrowia lipolytica]KAE8170341.1 hemolysin-III related-domain-containing protein [Yarrowia lipolytica]KAJ8052357.1 hemolysin-III related-domain-containing protein [Yarrowia lipolytica]RDW35177.1 hemolysin-III related-domain-containing protein [Yarrowia lipolytica]|eukprot:XP_500751.1 YALI0B11242p [Yarrowia lipolytica CLIB122]
MAKAPTSRRRSVARDQDFLVRGDESRAAKASGVSRSPESRPEHLDIKISTDDSTALEALFDEKLETSLLLKFDTFLKGLESRMDVLEDFSANKASQIDESIHNAVLAFEQIKEKVLTKTTDQKKKMEQFMHVIENNFNDFADWDTDSWDTESWTSQFSEVQKHLEQRLVEIEEAVKQGADELLHKATQAALEAAKKGLITINELPEVHRDNPYIIRGYRFYGKYSDCAKSVVTLHNETCNIWTHLGGFFVMLFLAFFHYPKTVSWEKSSLMDNMCMIVFLVAAMKCLVCSSIWHTFNSICWIEHRKKFACVDYTGITVLICASILTTEYTAFYCNPTMQTVYMTLTAFFGITGVFLSWDPKFDDPKNRHWRILFFVSFAVAGATSFIHNTLLHGVSNTLAFYLPVVPSLASYAAGVIFYSFLIPERWCPGGVFDYFGMSHNLWHIFVFGGIFYHYTATVKLLETAHSYACVA